VGKAKDKPGDVAIPPGGAKSSSIDATNEKDRGLIRQAMKNWPKRWGGLDAEFKAQIVEDLKVASASAKTLDDPQAAAQILVSVAKTAVAMEGQQQADDHLADKNERLDAGLLTENCAGQIFVIPPPTLPNKR